MEAQTVKPGVGVLAQIRQNRCRKIFNGTGGSQIDDIGKVNFRVPRDTIENDCSHAVANQGDMRSCAVGSLEISQQFEKRGQARRSVTFRSLDLSPLPEGLFAAVLRR